MREENEILEDIAPKRGITPVKRRVPNKKRSEDGAINGIDDQILGRFFSPSLRDPFSILSCVNAVKPAK